MAAVCGVVLIGCRGPGSTPRSEGGDKALREPKRRAKGEGVGRREALDIAKTRFATFRYDGGADAYANYIKYETDTDLWRVIFYEKSEKRFPWNDCCIWVDSKTGKITGVGHGQ